MKIYDANISGSVQTDTITVTGNYTVLASDYTILCSASSAFSVTIPSATTNIGRVLQIKKTDSTNTQVTITGSQNIDNSNNLIITEPYTAVTLQSDGTQWWIF